MGQFSKRLLDNAMSPKTVLVTHHFVRSDFSVLREHLLQLLFGEVISEVLDEHIGELLSLFSQLLLTLLARNKPPYEHLLLIEQHAVDLLNGVHGSFLGLEVDKPVSLWKLDKIYFNILVVNLAAAVSVLGNLAGENIPESRESIVHGLVVDRLVQILDENISDSRSSQGRITLAPHDPDGAPLQNIEVHGVQSSFSCNFNS